MPATANWCGRSAGRPAAPFPLPQAGSIFLGPPLPLRGQLYVLAEANDEIRLLALDAETGATLWSQQLAVVQHNVFPDAVRRIGGLSPSYADGILICPTGAGAVVAVDLATRSLRWGYRYGRDKNANVMRQQQMMAMRFGGYSAGAPMPRWLDGTATIVDGRVLITPAESDALYGLNLVDGTPLWDAAAAAGRPLRGLRPRRQDRAGGPARAARGESVRRQTGLGRARSWGCPPAAPPAAAASPPAAVTICR